MAVCCRHRANLNIRALMSACHVTNICVTSCHGQTGVTLRDNMYIAMYAYSVVFVYMFNKCGFVFMKK